MMKSFITLTVMMFVVASMADDHEEFTHTISLHGSGTTNPSKFYWQAMDLFEERSKTPLFMTYRAVGSSIGQAEFVGTEENGYQPYNHFGSGDIPMKAANYQLLTVNASRTMCHFPFVMGAIAIFHSVPTSNTGGELDLTPCLLARIFSRDITTWDHADIVAANPNLNVPANTPIKVVHRVKGSSSTSGTTEYLENACPGSWSLGSGSTITWPSDTYTAQGSGGMSSFIQSNEYAIGYIDAGHGHSLGLSEISLLNDDGVYLTSLQANVANAGTYAVDNSLIPTDPTADFSGVSLLNLPGASTWPITMMTYIYLQKDMSAMDGHEAGLLHAFLKYILSDEGQSLLEDKAFTRIPAEVVAYDNMILNTTIDWPADMVEFTFESSSTSQTYVGAGEYVISGKRRTYANYERDSFDSDITTLKADVASLTTTVETNAAAGSTCSCSNSDADDAKQIAAAAIALAVIAILISIAAIVCGSRQSNKNNGMDRCVPSVTKSGHVGNGSSSGTVASHEI